MTRFLTVVTCMIFAVFYAVLLIEWAAGCGESYTDAYNNTHQNECVFIKRGNKQ